MIEHIPTWIEIIFLVVFLITIVFFHIANGGPKKLTLLILVWSAVHAILAFSGFYHDNQSMPPRFLWVLAPMLLALFYGTFFSGPRRWAMENRNLRWSTFMHTIRIPIEIILYYLFVYKAVPGLMTFEGRNFDILAGITAPIMGLLLLKGKLPRKVLLAWNIVSLCLVLFILVNGLLSARLPFQQFAFEQPNIAVEYFPFILLPATIVPLVIYTHLIDILKLGNQMGKHGA
ncbi:MAG: hypothetical protein AB3N16_12090 [Flavobacteriaceae bacterium]